MESIDKCVLFWLNLYLHHQKPFQESSLHQSGLLLPREETCVTFTCDRFEKSSKNDRDIIQFKANIILTVQAPAPAWVDTADN